MVARFFEGYTSLEVTRQREVATDHTLLTGARGAERLEQKERNDYSSGSKAITAGGAN
jgi:hypothetical protein